MKEYKKLVRDNIPDIIERDGEKPITRVLDDEEFKKALQDKLVEEAGEVRNTTSRDELEKEIGDVLEVIESLIKAFNLREEEIEKTKEERKKKRGGFDKHIFLDHTE